MRASILLLLSCLACAANETRHPEGIEGPGDKQAAVELVTQVVKSMSTNRLEKVIIDLRADENGHSWALCMQGRMLLRFPQRPSKDALRHPSIVVRKIKYPDDVRKKGNKELESSTYLVTEDWFREKVNEVSKHGELRIVLSPDKSGQKN